MNVEFLGGNSVIQVVFHPHAGCRVFQPHQEVNPNPQLPVLFRLREAAQKSREAATTVVSVVQLLLVTRIYVYWNINFGPQI